MDRATENLLIRISGSFALTAVLVHAGLDAPRWPLPGLYLVPFFIAGVAANWALSRLNAKRAALWSATILLGLAPALMPLAHLGDLGQDALYDGVLYAAGAFGLATLAVGGLLLRQRDAPNA